MTRTLRVPISAEPDHCGRCRFLAWPSGAFLARCLLYGRRLVGPIDEPAQRLEECRAAEVEGEP